MNIVKLTDSLAVTAQITPEDVADIAAAGYKVLINNRPDGEEGTQPTAAAIGAVARAAGLEYHHLPVTALSFPGPDFDAMSDLLDDPARPSKRPQRRIPGICAPACPPCALLSPPPCTPPGPRARERYLARV